MSVGKIYSLTAIEKIVLTVAGSSITIDPTGITLNAPMITCTGIASISATAPAMTFTAPATFALTSAAVAVTGTTTFTGATTVVGALTWTSAFGPPPIPA